MNFDFEFQKVLTTFREEHRFRELSLPSGVSFVNNDYLGLSRHPLIIEAGREALSRWGAGSTGSRLLGGHSEVFELAEEAVARFFNAPAALIFSSGYLANLAAVRSLAPFVDHVISDEKNHASLIDGVTLAGKPKTILPHNQWNQVDAIKCERPLLVSESLFSMDGDLVDWETLNAAAARKNGFLILDEAHAAGVFLENGRGVSDGEIDWERTGVTVTFGKAFGVAGAAVLGSRALKDLLINSARSFIFTTAPSPAVPHMIARSLEVVEAESWRRRSLWDRAHFIRKRLLENELTSRQLPRPLTQWEWFSPVIPFLVPGDVNALRFCQNMRQSGFEFKAIRYPTVPKGQERLRISVGLQTDAEETERMTTELVKQWTAFAS